MQIPQVNNTISFYSITKPSVKVSEVITPDSHDEVAFKKEKKSIMKSAFLLSGAMLAFAIAYFKKIS